jgi:hypothetical protein
MSNRVGVRGALFSMSSFSSGAKSQAEDYASESMILFFGPGDIRTLFSEDSKFDDLLDAKVKSFISFTRVEFE